MMKKIKNQDGFTLLEVVISIAVLSILSVFILQLFISSANANVKAQNMDIATSKAMTMVDRFGTLETVTKESMAAAYPGFAVEKTSGGFALVMYYDREWSETAAPATEKEIKDFRGFRVNMTVTREAGDTSRAGALYGVAVSIVDTSGKVSMLEKDSQETALTKLENVKYFPNLQ